MSSQTMTLETFLSDCRDAIETCSAPSQIVLKLVPKMQELLKIQDTFLNDENTATSAETYARHPIHVCPEGGMSLFAMVWQPGQWTPVHDHGTWGVVGVARGTFEERGYIRCDADPDSCEGVELVEGGIVLLPAGGISTFVPDPDHIHVAGNNEARDKNAVTLHLYGREMSDYNEYCLESKTKTLQCYETMSDGS